MIGARGTGAVDHLTDVFIQRHPFEHYRATDDVPAQAGGTV